jgi:DNA polymerase elongation subunit (family B)
MASPILTIRQEKVSVHSKTDPLVFQATSWYAQDVDCKDIDGEDGFGDYNKYIIKAFGVTKEGYSVSASITGFTPYFYVRIPETWGSREIDAFREAILEKIPKAQQRNLILPIRVIRKKDFWGFTNFEDFKFIRLCFNNVKAMKSVVYQLAKPLQISRISHKPQKYTCYESNIDPYIRFIHINNLEPSGWLSLPAGTYQTSPDTLPTNAQIDVQVKWQDVQPHHSDQNARIIVCSFDLECMSDTGDFPVPKKDYKKLAFDLTETYNMIARDFPSDNYNQVESIKACLLDTFNMFEDPEGKYAKYTSNVHKVQTKSDQYNHTRVKNMLISLVDDVYNTLSNPTYKHEEKVSLINIRLSSESANLPPLKGDEIIQIGSTFHMYGDKEVTYKNIITLGGCNPIEGAEVITCKTEADLLIQWKNLIQKINPDIMTGYNIFGFDMWYLYERARDLGIESEFMCIGRLNESRCNYKENKLSSSALGDNILKFIDMEGRVLIDMMKVVQRDHKLDSYKLDAVASHFMKQNKHDVSPKDIFRLQRGSDEDRKIVADYCLQDCSLCNYLMMKLEILANNMGMSNVCLVPLSFIFMRGQGIKIFSLVLKQCKDEGFLIPVVKGAWSENAPEEDDEGYEGAIVLEPKEGIYIDDPVSVLDYASLYPSSMISENLSHDCYVEKGGKYDNLPGMEYLDISYDLYEGVGDKKKKNGERVCRFAQLPNGEKGIIPRILMKLLGARKATRKKMEWQVVKTKDGQEHKGFVNKGEHVTKVKLVEDNMREETVLNEEIDTIEPCFNEFQLAVLDGLQVAYKVTANSLYGQIGARTSPIYLKDIAACTTATGRKMIMLAKDFLEENYCANIVYGDSVASYTPITLQRTSDKSIVIDTIENIAVKYGNNNWIPCIESGRQDKEGCEIHGLNVWTADGWKDLHRVIRHQLAPHKKMWRVLTHTGLVDVTDDHSLLSPDGTKVSPNDLKVGSELLHHAMKNNRDSRNIYDFFTLDEQGSLYFYSYKQLDSARMFELASSAGYHVSIDYKNNIYQVSASKTSKTSSNVIQQMYEIPYTGYVYDLTTDNHQFQCGVGNIIGSNTDSLFICFPRASEENQANLPPFVIKQKGHAAIMPSIQLAIKASSEIKKLLKQPHDLEYEKTFWPFVLISKKRYVGNLYEQDDRKYKTKSMGIVLKRRDNAHIVKKVYGGIIDIILGSQDVVGSIDFLKTELNDLIEGKAPLEDLIITKALRSEYKDPTRIAHKVLAERMGERDPGNKPQINDRIPYVYVAQPPPIPGIPKCRQPKILQGERIEHPDYIRENKLVPDYGFYISNQIMKPVTQIYAIVADQIGIRSKDEYAAIYEEFVKMCEGNASKAKDKLEALREKDVKALLFDPYLKRIEEAINGGPVPEKKTRAQKFPLMLPSSEPIIVDGVPLPQDILPVKKTTARKKTATKTLVMDEETGIAEYKEAEQEQEVKATKKPAAKKAPAKTLIMNEETGITEYKTSEPQPSNQEGASTSKAKTPAPRKERTLVMNEETGITEYKETVEQPKAKAPAKKKALEETVNISEVTKIKTEEEIPIIKIKPRKPKSST